MQFFVQSSLHYQVSGPSTLLCSLKCVKTPSQEVLNESLSTSRDTYRSDMSLGLEENRFTLFETSEAGPLSIFYEATASTSVQTVPFAEINNQDVHTLDPAVIPYLFPSRYAPADRMRAVANDHFGGIQGHLDQALAIEDWLNKHIAYAPGSSKEQYSAMETYENRSGVCRDFAHLGIALCRALSIPARYVTVYAFQLQPQDFHAVFEVYVGGRWYLIDGTRIAPLNGMIRIAQGRDAADAAVATLFGNIAGTGIEVNTLVGKDETEVFQPLNRADLRNAGNALCLG
ncbi:MAG: transglutaminase family protein [Verrucomicrobiae bacterium]|nr:transglutaminase family protein [Verrucomicrobiae bacterium]